MEFENKYVIGFVVIVVVVVIFICCYPEHKEKFRTLRSEPNLTCALGGVECNLSSGIQGICDKRTSRCVEPPYWADERKYRLGYESQEIGEISGDCLWRGVCSRNDGTMGVCMTGLCYPNSHAV